MRLRTMPDNTDRLDRRLLKRPIGLPAMLKPHDEVVGVSDDNHTAPRVSTAPLEAEERQLLQHLEGGTQAVDYAESNRRLAEIQSELAGASDEWERAAVELEELLAEFGDEPSDEHS